MNQQYWDIFYQSSKAVYEPSLFAEFVEPWLAQHSKLIDLGCGNGRDSYYFADKGHEVIAVDLSESAIAKLKYEEKEGITAYCDNFVSFLEKYNGYFDAVYSRFSMHAITQEEQERLLKNVYRSLKENGLFFIEARSVQDELYGKGKELGRDTYFFNEHARRFLRMEELTQQLKKEGFALAHMLEKRGFAPFFENNPIVLRIIARKGALHEKAN